MHNFKELKIWQEGMEKARAVYKVTSNFPSNEKYGLTSQINRAVVSIPSNIAEGAGRNSNKAFLQFLNIALGSAFELETQLILAHDFGFINESILTGLVAQLQKIQKMFNRFNDRLRKEKS